MTTNADHLALGRGEGVCSRFADITVSGVASWLPGADGIAAGRQS